MFHMLRRSSRLCGPFSSGNSAVAILIISLLIGITGRAATVRPRDPWAFRLILENKTHMLAVALRSDLWCAYNPTNCGLYKVWGGTGAGMVYEGKVWDFSENCSFTTGTNFHIQENTVLSANTTTSIPTGWTASGITTGSTYWTFNGQGSTFTSPVINLTGYDNPLLFFNEHNSGAIHVQVSQDGGATWAQEFDSTQSGNDPQQNIKKLIVSGSNVVIRWIMQQNVTSKAINGIAILGDYRLWSATQNTTTVNVVSDWRGYRFVNVTDSIFMQYNINSQSSGALLAAIEESPEMAAPTGAAMTRTFNVSNLAASTTVSVKLNAPATSETWSIVSGNGTLRRDVGNNTFLDLSNNGTTVVKVTWP